MRLTLRLDDITPRMEMTKFERFRALMDAQGIRPLLGVVPDAQDAGIDYVSGQSAAGAQTDAGLEAAFWEMLSELTESGYTVAMHGLTHVYTTKKAGLFPLNRNSEFAGVSQDAQRRMIAEGKERLAAHGISTDIFMAPAHSFDRNTLKALSENGFTKITDGFGTAPYTYGGMTFYPISFQRKKSIARAYDRVVLGAADNGRRGSLQEKADNKSLTTLVVHTNTMTEAEFAMYERLFTEKQFVPYSTWDTIQPKPLPAAKHMGHYLMAGTKRMILRGGF